MVGRGVGSKSKHNANGTKRYVIRQGFNGLSMYGEILRWDMNVYFVHI